MKRLLLLGTLFLLLVLLLPVNWFLARQAAPPPWPDDIAAHHRSLAVNMDLADLARLSDPAREGRLRLAWEDGAHIIRLRVPWALIQPEPDVWDWRAFEQVVGTDDFDFLFILALDGAPAWARAPEDASNPYAPPRDVRDFGRFAGEVAQRTPLPLSTSGPGRVLAFQIWDEPNIGPHWGARYADPQGYLDLLREAHYSIRHARPDARIMLAALAPTTTDDGFNIPDPVYLDRLLSLGAGDYFDFAAGQAYGFDQPPEAPPAAGQLNFRRVELLHDVLARHGLGDRPLYITAWGWWTPQAPGLDPETSPWRSIPVEDLHAYQQRGWAWMQAHWPWASAPAWVQYAPGPDDAAIRLGWVQRDAAGQQTPAGEGVAALAQSLAPRGAGAYRPDDRSSIIYQPPDGWRTTRDAGDPDASGVEASLHFRGRAAALKVQRGPFKGYFEVWIDGRPAPDLPVDPATGNAYLMLYDPDNRVATVPVARDLVDGEHELRIRAQGGWGYWPLRRIVIDDRPHPRPWPFWPITAALVMALGGAGWVVSNQFSVFSNQYSVISNRYSVHPRLSAFVRVLAMLAAWLPAAALVALPFYMRPLRLGPIGLPLHELLIWLGLGAAVGYWVLSKVQSPMSGVAAGAEVRDAGRGRFLDAAVLLLLVIGFFAALNAAEKGYAFYDWRVTFLTPAVFYFLITRFTLRQADGVKRLGQAALLGGVLVSLIALGQFVAGQAGMAEGVPRVQALYGSANNLALVLGRLLPLAVALAFWRKEDRKPGPEDGKRRFFARRLFYGFALIVIAAAGFLTFSKGLLFISMPVGLLVLFIFQRSLRKPILILAVLGALALIPFLNTPRLAQITSGTGRFRVYLWLSAWRMGLDHPWLGVGLDNFLYAYRSYYVLPAAWEELNLSHPHNLIFDLLTRVGLMGFLAGMWLVLGTIWLGLRRLRVLSPEHPLRPWVLGLGAGFVAGMAHGLIDNSLFLPDLMILSLLVAGVMTVSCRAERGGSTSP